MAHESSTAQESAALNGSIADQLKATIDLGGIAG
jgi:hypothetical protein